MAEDADRPDRRLAQPFSGWTHEQMSNAIDKFIEVSGLEDYAQYIRRGAFLAQSKAAFPVGRERRDGLKLKDIERHYLDLEYSPRRIDKFKRMILVPCKTPLPHRLPSHFPPLDPTMSTDLVYM